MATLRDLIRGSNMNETFKISKLELMAIQNAIGMLNSRGCVYTVIDPNGDKYSNMPDIEERKKIVRTQSFKEYVNPILDNLKVNDFIAVPFDKYDGPKLQANLCARANTRWGSKAIMTSINREKQVIEIIREK